MEQVHVIRKATLPNSASPVILGIKRGNCAIVHYIAAKLLTDGFIKLFYLTTILKTPNRLKMWILRPQSNTPTQFSTTSSSSTSCSQHLHLPRPYFFQSWKIILSMPITRKTLTNNSHINNATKFYHLLQLLPPPQEGSNDSTVPESICLPDYSKSCKGILTKFFGGMGVAEGPIDKILVAIWIISRCSNFLKDIHGKLYLFYLPGGSTKSWQRFVKLCDLWAPGFFKENLQLHNSPSLSSLPLPPPFLPSLFSPPLALPLSPLLPF